MGHYAYIKEQNVSLACSRDTFVIYFLSAPGQSDKTGSKSLKGLFELEDVTSCGLIAHEN